MDCPPGLSTSRFLCFQTTIVTNYICILFLPIRFGCENSLQTFDFLSDVPPVALSCLQTSTIPGTSFSYLLSVFKCYQGFTKLFCRNFSTPVLQVIQPTLSLNFITTTLRRRSRSSLPYHTPLGQTSSVLKPSPCVGQVSLPHPS